MLAAPLFGVLDADDAVDETTSVGCFEVLEAGAEDEALALWLWRLVLEARTDVAVVAVVALTPVTDLAGADGSTAKVEF